MRSLIEDDWKQQEIEIPADGISLDLLRAVYRSNQLPLTTRMRAAIVALPHEVPKSEQDFATVLDRRLKRIEEMKLIEAKPTIDGVEGKPADVRLPPVVPDRRFRRM